MGSAPQVDDQGLKQTRLWGAADGLRRAAAQLPHLTRALWLCWGAAPRWTLAWLVCLVVQGLLPVAVVYLTRAVVNRLTALRGAHAGWDAVGALAGPALLLAAALAAIEIARGLARWIRAAQTELVRDHVMGLVHEQAARLDYAAFEDAQVHDRIHRVRADASTRPAALLESAGGLLQNGITVVAMAGVLVPYGWWLPAVLLISTLPAFSVVLHHAQRQFEWRRRVTPLERRVWYYDWLLTAREAAAELRLFDLAGHFRAQYRRVRTRLREEQMRLVRDEARAEALAGLAALGASGLVLGWTLLRTLTGALTLGDAALLYQAFSQGQTVIRGLLGSASQTYANGLFLRELFDFLALRPALIDAGGPGGSAVQLAREVRFRDVTFAYPGAERAVLEHFDFAIPAGLVVTVVGHNGAGKSTLLKLLCRLYDPVAGAVELDGVDFRAIPLRDLRRAITVLFQDPVHYAETAATNIALADLDGSPADERIRAAAHGAGADAAICRLPLGYETVLSKWFGGAELSTGEWQRVALARAFLRRTQLILLDEPTSAMDSWAETDWLDRFRELTRGATALIISHRFTTARRADVIHVMDRGRIVESGSHAELVARGGAYAQSWARQVGDNPISHAENAEDAGARREDQ